MNKPSLQLCLFLTAFPALAAIEGPAGVSEKLRPAANEQAAFVLNAQGVQIYTCKQDPKDPYAYAWSFVAPEATLSEAGVTVGRHYAGPTWESSSDRSSVKGSVRERQDGGAGNIPWLLLAATPSAAEGKFAGVTSVQRVATRGGVEPAQVCDASNAGREARVPYTADYYFFRKP
jgi:hypothetical protein